MARRKAGDKNVRIGNVTGVSGKVTIAAGDVYEGYTAEQVSVLLTQITTTLQPKPFDGRCPYKGLDVFEEEDANLFFGRERLVQDLLNRVRESRTVFITGPSGSGKSSLVRAGLLHALKQGQIQNSERWLYEIMKPGREPIKELSLAFSRLKSPELAHYFQERANDVNILNECAESVLTGQKTQHFVLFVDQFEEVFTQVNREEERSAFLNMLAHAGAIENGRVIVLFAMRSDFISNCAAYPMLNELLSQEFRQIGAMQPEELVSAIALPAKEVGLPIEDELIARIINDMKGEPGALPLMQFALKDLFDSQQSQGGVIALTLEDYLKHGGIQKSLERHADASLAALDEKSQQLARSIFSGLIEIGRGTADTKRTALFDELVPANASAADVLAIVQKLADARLIITDEQAGKDTVTISHEKLIEAWPWLKKLVNENRDAIALQNEIANDAKEWEDHRRDPSYLYSGARLANAREQLDAKKLALSGLAFEFVQAARAQQRRRLLANRLAIAAIGVALTVAVVIFSFQSQENAKIAATAQAASTYAVAQQATAQANAEEAQKQATIARTGELVAQSMEMREKNFQISLLLAIEAFRSWDTVQSRGTLLDVSNANPQLIQFLNGYTDLVVRSAFSPDGKTLIAVSRDGTIVLWDAERHQPIGQPFTMQTTALSSAAFSPDGKILAAGTWDNKIILWNVETHQTIGQHLTEHTSAISSVAFSPDGKILASSSWDNTVILWNVETHQPIAEPLTGNTSAISSVAFSPDGKILAAGSGDNTAILWDVETRQLIGQLLTGQTKGVFSIAFSPDGKTLAAGSGDGMIILWDVETRQTIGQPLRGHRDAVFSIIFSSDGKTLVSGSRDHTIILWDLQTHQPIGQPLRGHSDAVNSLVFSPDGKILASSSWDNNIILWNIFTLLKTRQLIGQSLTGQTNGVFSVAFSPDGKTIASGGGDGEIILWDVKTHQSIGQPLRGQSELAVGSIAFSPNGKTIASGSWDNTIILWDVQTHQRIGEPFSGHTDSVTSVAFSPDGKILASGSWDKTIILWDMETHQPIGQPLKGHTDRVSSIAFSPVGKILASGGVDSTIFLWDVKTHQPIGQPLGGHSYAIDSIAFSPDGKTIASGSENNIIILWDVETRQPIGQPLRGHSDMVTSVAFSPDGKTLASGSEDVEIILWDVKTRQSIGQPLRGHTDRVSSIAFSPDGKILASGSADNTIILWDLNPQSWKAMICQRVGRNFSRAEWAQYFPNEEYRKTCEQWPLEPEATPTSSPTP